MTERYIQCALGDIGFCIGDYGKTFTNFSENRVFNYTKNDRTGKVSLLRRRGIEPTEISFDMVFDPTYARYSIRDALDQLADYAERGTKLRFMMANKIVRGTFFVVTGYTLTAEQYGGDGAIVGGKIAVTLTEYANEIKGLQNTGNDVNGMTLDLEGITAYDG